MACLLDLRDDITRYNDYCQEVSPLAACRRLFPLRSARCAFFSEPRTRYGGPVCSAAVHFPGFLLWCKVIVIAAGPWPLPVRLSVWTRLFPRRNPKLPIPAQPAPTQEPPPTTAPGNPTNSPSRTTPPWRCHC